MEWIRLPARLEHLATLLGFVSAFLRENGLSGPRIQEIELATEEALVNVFNYAYSGREPGEVEIRCLAEEGFLRLEFLDSGTPFDLNALAEPDLDASLPERKVGGLGVFLIRKMVDEVRYRREGDRNILTFLVRKPQGRERGEVGHKDE